MWTDCALYRFVYDFALQRRVKLYDAVSFPDTLDMSPFLFEAPAVPDANVYELFSVLVHFGTAMGGHYFAYVKVSIHSINAYRYLPEVCICNMFGHFLTSLRELGLLPFCCTAELWQVQHP